MNINTEIEKLPKRYSVFVSSPYKDLIDFRKAAIQAILDENCFPTGMEMFPPADEEQFSFIKRVIEESDFYFVMVGGRYGSLHSETGIGYTEMEYNYAESIGKPIIALVLDEAQCQDEFVKEDTKSRVKLLEFRDRLRKKRVSPDFETTDGLKYLLSRGIREEINKGKLNQGLVRCSEILEIIGSFQSFDDEEREEYIEALERLTGINTSEVLWRYVHNVFHSIRNATHNLIYDAALPKSINPLFKSCLIEALINLERFMEEVLNIRLRVSLKDLSFANGKWYTQTIASTNGILKTGKKVDLSRYPGLHQLVGMDSSEWDLCVYQSNDVVKDIKSKLFNRGRFSVEQFKKMKDDPKKLPYRSTLCVPIRNADEFAGGKIVTRGFLCIDSPDTNAFDHEAAPWMAAATGDSLYLFMTIRELFMGNKALSSPIRKSLHKLAQQANANAS